MMEENRNVPAIERRTRDACGSDDDQTFVCRRISAKPESECREYRKAGRIGKVTLTILPSLQKKKGTAEAVPSQSAVTNSLIHAKSL
jgi:hypothetical protein